MASDPMPATVMRPPGKPGNGDAVSAVTVLYQNHALAMIRLAHVILGDRTAAEDVVQEAFAGLYRRWGHVSDRDKALSYVRSSVINACRSALRRTRPEPSGDLSVMAWRPEQPTGETVVLYEEERVAVMAAVRKLPHRQREVLVLRFYLDMTDKEIAAEMGIGVSTVRSSAHRGLVALGRTLGEST